MLTIENALKEDSPFVLRREIINREVQYGITKDPTKREKLYEELVQLRTKVYGGTIRQTSYFAAPGLVPA